jgi:adenylylsulfate kinase
MVIILCGVPGSGKSTVARKLAANLRRIGRVKLFVSDEVSGRVYQRVSKFLNENLDEADYILLDATFYKKKWREMVKAIAGEKNVVTCYLHCSLQTCLERNKERKPSLPERVIHIISKEIEYPQGPEISINTGKMGPEEAVYKTVARILSLRKQSFENQT